MKRKTGTSAGSMIFRVQRQHDVVLMRCSLPGAKHDRFRVFWRGAKLIGTIRANGREFGEEELDRKVRRLKEKAGSPSGNRL